MGKLAYNGQCWVGESESLFVSMDDATFQKHLQAYLEHIGASTQTLLQLWDYERRIHERRYQAGLQLANPEFWRGCNDPCVTVRPLK